MSSSNERSDRLHELEIKAVLADDLLEQLNKAVFRQQQQIDALAQEVRTLRQHLPQERNTLSIDQINELPPHY